VEPLGLAGVNPVFGHIEVGALAPETGRIAAGIPPGDGPYPALPGTKSLPILIHRLAQRRDNPKTRDDNAATHNDLRFWICELESDQSQFANRKSKTHLLWCSLM